MYYTVYWYGRSANFTSGESARRLFFLLHSSGQCASLVSSDGYRWF